MISDIDMGETAGPICAILSGVDRLFTVDEARSLLAEHQGSISEFLALRAEFAELRFALEREGPGDRGGVAELKALEARLDLTLSGLRERGVQIKGIAPLLLDFASERDGQSVLLCWLEGEPTLDWYHPVELGLMGRRPL